MSDADPFAGPGPDKIYRDHLAAGRLELPHCRDCGRHHFDPRALCPHCASPHLEWRTASGKGVVYSTSVVRQKPEAGGDYNVALIDLAEGPRLMSRVDGIAPTDVRIGMAVTAQIITERDQPLLVFQPA